MSNEKCTERQLPYDKIAVRIAFIHRQYLRTYKWISEDGGLLVRSHLNQMPSACTACLLRGRQVHTLIMIGVIVFSGAAERLADAFLNMENLLFYARFMCGKPARRLHTSRMSVRKCGLVRTYMVVKPAADDACRLRLEHFARNRRLQFAFSRPTRLLVIIAERGATSIRFARVDTFHYRSDVDGQQRE
jgi:hypothetical protein